MLSRLFRGRSNSPGMERGSYSKVDQGDDAQDIEKVELLADAKPLTETVDGAYMTDGDQKKRIDYVLVYETCAEKEERDDDAKEEAKELARHRKSFERRLQKKGLQLRRHTVIAKKEPEVQRHFVLIHAPWETLASRAEEMRLKVPLQPTDVHFSSWFESMLGEERVEKLKKSNPLLVKDATVKEKPDYFMGHFKLDLLTKFAGHEDKENFFTIVDRLYIVQRMMQSTRFSSDRMAFGLERLVLDGAYIAHYPLHEGTDQLDPGETPTNDRQRLRRDWARFGRCFKYQPYDAIKDYFGHEVALYFAWLGFYTAMMVPLAIVALVVFLYGIISAGSHVPVLDICNENNDGVWYMCPICDKTCSYWNLAPTTCFYAKITHFFDNDATVILAFVASIWATLFLECWKRRQATIAQEWHTLDFEKEDQPLRPQYARSLTEEELHPFRPDPKTGKIEFRASKIKQYRRYTVVFSFVTFMIFLVIAAVIGVVVFKAASFATLSSNPDKTVQKRARILATGVAAFLNLLAITLLKYIYNKLAVWLTNWENPPFRTAYEDSFTWKMALFQFVNTFASIIYIAFFKSELIAGTPGRYKRVLGMYRLQSCSEQGCFLELCIQIFIIMVGQQIIGNIIEVGIPSTLLWIKRRNMDNLADQPQYLKDYQLSTLEDHYLFWDYLEIVLQYGFVTMFVAAFPLAPIFALINAIFEIRVDAINFVAYHKRPDTHRVEDIGAWYSVLDTVTKAAVLMNAFILAFTSEFIPKLLYRVMYAPDRNSRTGATLKGYVNNSLSYIDLNTLYAWEPGTEPNNPTENLNYTRNYCRYPGYYDNVYPYGLSRQYWHLITARLAFVLAFQFVVYSVTSMIGWVIPDIPENLQFKIEREKQVVRAALEASSDDDSDEDDDGKDDTNKKSTGETAI